MYNRLRTQFHPIEGMISFESSDVFFRANKIVQQNEECDPLAHKLTRHTKKCRAKLILDSYAKQRRKLQINKTQNNAFFKNNKVTWYIYQNAAPTAVRSFLFILYFSLFKKNVFLSLTLLLVVSI